MSDNLPAGTQAAHLVTNPRLIAWVAEQGYTNIVFCPPIKRGLPAVLSRMSLCCRCHQRVWASLRRADSLPDFCAAGGTNQHDNLQTLCQSCNSRKGAGL